MIIVYFLHYCNKILAKQIVVPIVEILKYIALAVLSYFIGCFNAAHFISTRVMKTDIREHGSGNPGSANMMRAFGAKAGVAVFFLDAAKGFLAMQLTALFGVERGWGTLVCGLFVVAGHNWPATMHFKGGKGVATTIGSAFAYAPIITAVCLAAALMVVAITKYVSVGALFGIGSAVIVLLILDFYWQQRLLMSLLFAISLWQHRANITRLRSGTEAKFTNREKRDAK